MANYRGPVAFSFDPPDAFWTDENTFEKFVIATFKGTDTYDEDYSVYEGSGFELADNKDTAGCYGKADSVEDFVNDNLDLSTCPDTSVLDAYVNVDEARLVVKVLSSDADIAEIKHWEITPYETMTLERVDSIGDDTYELIFKIDGLNRMYKELYDEVKIQVFDKILNESYDGHKETVSKDLIKPYKQNFLQEKNFMVKAQNGSNLRESARVRLSVELRQFVGRFVQDMETAREGIKDYDEMMDALAELAIREANWVGLPVEVLRNLNFILSDDCLNCDMWDLINHIIKLTNKKD